MCQIAVNHFVSIWKRVKWTIASENRPQPPFYSCNPQSTATILSVTPVRVIQETNHPIRDCRYRGFFYIGEFIQYCDMDKKFHHLIIEAEWRIYALLS